LQCLTPFVLYEIALANAKRINIQHGNKTVHQKLDARHNGTMHSIEAHAAVQSVKDRLTKACPSFTQHQCTECNLADNRYNELPTKEQHLNRNADNECAQGALLPLAQQQSFPSTLVSSSYYVDENTCKCWKRMSVVTSAFHEPWKNLKFVQLRSDCSSSEIEIPKTDEDKTSFVVATNNQQMGSFNFFDSGVSKMGHTSADVAPCVEYGHTYNRHTCD